jgi:hypothetical protein
LQHRGPVAWAIVGRKNKRTQRRHLTGLERALKLRGFAFFVNAVSLSALNAFTQLLFKRSENLIAPFCVLPALLIIVEPERRVNAHEHEN